MNDDHKINTDISCTEVFHVSDEEIGRGYEHTCRWLLNPDGSKTDRVIKFLHEEGFITQAKNEHMAAREFNILNREFGDINGVDVDPSLEIHQKCLLVMQNGHKEFKDYAITSNFIKDFDDQVVTYLDLIGPNGPNYIRSMVDLLKAEKRIFEIDDCVFDILGLGEIVSSFMESLPKATVLGISRLMPKILKDMVRSNIDGVKGGSGNFVKDGDGGLKCIDIGMYHFKQSKILDRLGKSYYIFTFTALMEIVKHVNLGFPEELRISDAEIISIDCGGSRFRKGIARQITKEMMIPLFERHARLRLGQKGEDLITEDLNR
ncbi:hypothetical protein ACFL21_00850 [Patescibacteria group bacterium]